MIILISDSAARRIASEWQSAGSIGRHLAAIASKAWLPDDLDEIAYESGDIKETRRDHLIDDIDRTLGSVVNNEDRKELDDLREWANYR